MHLPEDRVGSCRCVAALTEASIQTKLTPYTTQPPTSRTALSMLPHLCAMLEFEDGNGWLQRLAEPTATGMLHEGRHRSLSSGCSSIFKACSSFQGEKLLLQGLDGSPAAEMLHGRTPSFV